MDLVTVASAGSGIITWTGAGGDVFWANPENWDLGRIPNALDTVMITTDYASIQLYPSVAVAYLYVGAASTRVSLAFYDTLQVDSAVVIAEGSALGSSYGTLAGGGDVFVQGTFDCSQRCVIGGYGDFSVESGGTLYLQQAAIDGRLIRNEGTIRWDGIDYNITMRNGAQIVNDGTFDIYAAATMSSAGGAAPALTNNGTMVRYSSPLSLILAVPFYNNGSVRVLRGTVRLDSTSVHTNGSIEVGNDGTAAELHFAAGTHVLDGASTLLLGPDGIVSFDGGNATMSGSYGYSGAATGLTQVTAGAVNLNGSTTVTPRLVQSGGHLGTTTTILVTDSMAWTGGTLAGPGTIRIDTASTLVVSGTGAKTVDALTIDNLGTALWTSGSVTGTNAAQFLNDASAAFEMQSDGTWGGDGTFDNNGAFLYTGATIGTLGWALTNAGTLDAVGPSGILRLIGDFTHQDDAIIQGSGTIDFTSTSVLGWDGDVNPGGIGTTGILNFLGNGSPSALFTANIDIGGTSPGTAHDQATMSGEFIANGTLNVNILPVYTPTLNDRFTILTYGSRTGEFSDTLGTDLGGGLVLDLEWGDTQLDLVVNTAAPGPGEQIVFFSDSGASQDVGVFRVDSDGSDLFRVADTGPTSNYRISPRWSPDRQRVAFSFDGLSGYNELLLSSADGSEHATLVNDRYTGYPHWSHNGQHLGFVCSTTVEELNEICVFPDVTGAITSIPLNGYSVATAVLPAAWADGQAAAAWDPVNPDRFVFARDSTGAAVVSRFFSADYDGGNLDTITTDLMDLGNGPIAVETMDISSNGAMIVFSGYTPTSGVEKLYVMNVDGTGLRQLTFLSGYDDTPLFSPDGSEVIFARQDQSTCFYDYWIVGIGNADGSEERRITTDEFYCEESPYELVGYDWSPDGSQIGLVGADETTGFWRIYVVPNTVTDANYQSVRMPVGRNADAVSWLREIQPSWRP
jgi:Tol biopolymer transport system component